MIGVALSGGGGSEASTPPPPGCLERWNGDPAALVYGRHNYIGHRYTSAQVRLLSARRERSAPAMGIAPPSSRHLTLDSEPFFAGQLYAGGRWEPLSKLPAITDVRLAELQVEAQSAANVSLGPDGTLVPIS